MTITEKTLETNMVEGESVADPVVEQQYKLMDEASLSPVPWSVLAPSDYAFLNLRSSFEFPGANLKTRVAELTIDKKSLTKSALLAAVLALVDTRVANLVIEEKDYVFGLFVSQAAWVSKGGSQVCWPEGSIESNLQRRLEKAPVKVRDLVAGWIGSDRPDPWGYVWSQIFERLVRHGIIELHQEEQSFLFFNWKKTTHWPATRMKEILADYANVARETGLGLPFRDHSPLRLAQRDVISGDIGKGFMDRTESDSD